MDSGLVLLSAIVGWANNHRCADLNKLKEMRHILIQHPYAP